ncbi:hypothetical protein BGZ83_001108 [Gryganskiella cystojenkinii]|nr:hypothetical protein BGZ83_001108 [Gryganskiella cystojenkinii]
MCSAIFEDYLQELCQHCHDEGYTKVVFVMNNACYHCREKVPLYKVRTKHDLPVVSADEETGAGIEEALGEGGDDQWADEALAAEPEPAKRRTLSNLGHHELVERLAHFVFERGLVPVWSGSDNCDEHWANLVRHSHDVSDAYIERGRIYIGPPREGGSER